MASKMRKAKNIVEEKIIEAVKLRPVIYKKSDPGHCNSTIVENVWRFVFDQIGGVETIDSGIFVFYLLFVLSVQEALFVSNFVDP
jgi:hypothetical protein